MRRPSRGVTLIEALIALLVVGVGLVALAGVALTLSRNAESARLRSEATRLAQDRLESLRAFERIDAQAGAAAYADIEPGSDAPAPASPAGYVRTWRVVRGEGDWQRLVIVEVAWTDRNAGADGRASVVLHSVIARSDPADAGAAAVPRPGNAPWRLTRERSLDIPFEATRLYQANRGRSVLPWTGGSSLVFDDASGLVVARCPTPGVGDATDIAAACAALQPGVLIEGTIRGAVPSDPSSVAIVFSQMQFLAAGTSPECRVERAFSRPTGAALDGMLNYRCLIQPADHDGNPATPRAWSGRVTVAGLSAGSVLCRYTRGGANPPNEEHPDTYTLVRATLSQQNFAVVNDASCPADTAVQGP